MSKSANINFSGYKTSMVIQTALTPENINKKRKNVYINKQKILNK